jgi:DmsE family decaheme c-type cytochrome
MRHPRRTIFAFALILLSFVFAFAIRGARSTQTDAVSDEACLDCHESQVHAMVGTAHDPAAGRFVSCLGCHAGAATDRHLDDPDENPAVNPAHMRADSVTAVCATCHEHPHTLNLYERDPHADADLSCTACHRVHDNTHLGLLKDEQKTLCFSCHPSAQGDFAMPSHHPVMEGVVVCSDCHLSVAQSSKQRVYTGPGGTCTTCHAMFEGPYPYEHQAAVDYSTEEGGCLNCHAAHGSAQPRLLKQSYQSPDFALCSQCHVVPKHQNNVNHGSSWAGMPCNDCHVDVHGSYDNAKLLDPSLAAQGCTAVGCHQF